MAKLIISTQDNLRFFTKYKNTPDFIPEAGDVFVITGGKFGHVGIVKEKGTLNYFNTIEQNNNGNQRITEEKRTYRTAGELYFLRPLNRKNLEEVTEVTEETNKNIEDIIIYNKGDIMKYKNGSTAEAVYADADLKKKIGEIYPWGECESLGEVNGRKIVLYSAGNTKKIGFVNFKGL